MTELLPDGLYFGLDEDTYHAQPRLSASLMKWLRVSPRDFWVRCWMNPDRPEEEDSFARILGRAYHKRILEGSAAFTSLYAAALNKEDYPNALVTNDQIVAVCRERNIKIGKKKADNIAFLLAADRDVQVWDDMEERYARRHTGMTLLDSKVLKRIETAAALIEKHPQLGKTVSGGYPEVSIFWTDAETGVKCKSRLDYLKVQAIVDLKSFGNPLDKPIDVAVRNAIASRGYFVQAAMYQRALEEAIAFTKAGNVHGEVDETFLKNLVSTEQHNRRFVFLMQDTGPAQVARAYIFPRGSVHAIGDQIVRECIDLFAKNHKAFGDVMPWVDTADITELDDLQFPAWIGRD